MALLKLQNGSETLVDETDIKELSKFKWRLHSDGYVVRFYFEVPPGEGSVHSRRKHKIVRLHRQLMSAPINLEVDHINRNPLDNRRSNLRLATRSQNARNTGLRKDNKSGHIGVTWDKCRNKWMAIIKINGVAKTLGRFSEKSQAVKARTDAELLHYGSFSRLAVAS